MEHLWPAREAEEYHHPETVVSESHGSVISDPTHVGDVGPVVWPSTDMSASSSSPQRRIGLEGCNVQPATALVEVQRERSAREAAEFEIRRLIEDSQQTVLRFVASLELETARIHERLDKLEVLCQSSESTTNSPSNSKAMVTHAEQRFEMLQQEVHIELKKDVSKMVTNLEQRLEATEHRLLEVIARPHGQPEVHNAEVRRKQQAEVGVCSGSVSLLEKSATPLSKSRASTAAQSLQEIDKEFAGAKSRMMASGTMQACPPATPLQTVSQSVPVAIVTPAVAAACSVIASGSAQTRKNFSLHRLPSAIQVPAPAPVQLRSRSLGSLAKRTPKGAAHIPFVFSQAESQASSVENYVLSATPRSPRFECERLTQSEWSSVPRHSTSGDAFDCIPVIDSLVPRSPESFSAEVLLSASRNTLDMPQVGLEASIPEPKVVPKSPQRPQLPWYGSNGVN